MKRYSGNPVDAWPILGMGIGIVIGTVIGQYLGQTLWCIGAGMAIGGILGTLLCVRDRKGK